MPTSRHLPCVAYFTCPRSRLNSPSARLFLIDRINEHKSGKKPLITARDPSSRDPDVRVGGLWVSVSRK